MPEFCTGCGPNRSVKETDVNEKSHCHTSQPANMWWVTFKLHYEMQIVHSLKYKISLSRILNKLHTHQLKEQFNRTQYSGEYWA
jgi:hypothetical protein